MLIYKDYKIGDLVKHKNWPRELLIYLGGQKYFLIYDNDGKHYFGVLNGLNPDYYFKYEG